MHAAPRHTHLHLHVRMCVCVFMCMCMCMCMHAMCMCVQVYDDNDVGGDRLMGHARILLSRDELRRMSTHTDAPLTSGDGPSEGEAAHGPRHYTQQLLPPWDELPGRSAPAAAPRSGAKAAAAVGAGADAASRARGRALSGVLVAQLQKSGSFSGHPSPRNLSPGGGGGASLAPAPTPAPALAAQGGGALAGLLFLPPAGSHALTLPPPRSAAAGRPGLTRQGTVRYTRDDAVRGLGLGLGLG